MKTKTEIRTKIQHLYELKKKANKIMIEDSRTSLERKRATQILDYCILSLKWAIGYKVKFTGHHYWCLKCNVMHENIQCPWCGNSTVREISND